MKHKIIYVVLVTMLMIGSFFVGAVNINSSGETSTSNISIYEENDAELPTWKVGDYWTYNIKIVGKYGTDMNFDMSISNLKFQVTDDTDATYYKMSVTGGFSGSGSYMGILSGQIRDGSMTGEGYVDKSTLTLTKLENMNMDGTIAFVPFDVDIYSMDITPHSPYDFPINVGETWNVPNVIMTIDGYVNNPGLVAGELYMELHSFEHTVQCLSKENKNGYEALKIRGNFTDYWYSPDAGNVVYVKNYRTVMLYLWGLEEYYYEITTLEITLKDTTYDPPNEPPNTPNIPSGETAGYANVGYTYETSATDPNSHRVKYGFDWGDGY